MHKQVRELIEWAESIGFSCGEPDGRGHYPLTHSNGETYRIASTPSEYRGFQNSKADMRRIAGVSELRPNSGRYRKGMSARERVRHLSTDAEVEATVAVNRLRAAHRRACDDIAALQQGGGRRQREEAVRRLVAIENQFEGFGFDPPVRVFRYLGEPG